MTASPKLTPVHLFSLIRLKPECKVIPTTVDFSPFIPSQLGRSVAPVFNHDRCPSTPAFVLGFDQKSLAASLQAERVRFEVRLRESLSMSEEDATVGSLQQAAPLSNYCQICQEHFQNYDLHVALKTHVLRTTHNEFNEDIQRLCTFTDPLRVRPAPAPKHRPIHKLPRPTHPRPSPSPKTTVDNYPKRKLSVTEPGMSDCQLELAVVEP